MASIFAQSVKTIAKKTFSLALIFNALMTLACVTGILLGFYRSMPYWQPYAPYFLDGNLFWLILAAALINIFPSASIGRALHISRFLFHHYVYGFFVLFSSSVFVVAFTPFSLFSIFLVDNHSISVNASRVLLLGGLTLLLDDLPDVSKRVETALNWIKTKAYRARKALHTLQIVTGIVSLYAAVSVILATIQGSARALPDSFFVGTLLVTSVTSFACAKRRTWLKITPPN